MTLKPSVTALPFPLWYDRQCQKFKEGVRMKKLVASFATGIIIAGTAASTVSAEEYEVKKGDNLWDIANEYNTTVENLVDINELKSTMIQPKQTLFINDKYKVQEGDTLTSISNEYDVSVDNLKDWNNLESDIIVIGQELTIEGVNVSQDDKPAAKVEKKAKAEEPKETAKNTQNTSSKEPKEENPEGKTISVEATAYTADCEGCSGVTSTGVDLNKNPDAKVIAVDPNVIPLGSKVHVEGYGYATAADIGSAIKGNKIDVHVQSEEEATNWGVKSVDVTIVE